MKDENFLSIIDLLDELIKKLNDNQVSQKDIEALREIIFHLDSMIIRVKKENANFPFLPEIIKDLTTANEHLRKVLLDEEKTTFNHSESEKQDSNNQLFASLINQIKNI